MHAGRAMPVLILAALSLIGFCRRISLVLATFTGIDALTAYLATSPRLGLDRHHRELHPQVDCPSSWR